MIKKTISKPAVFLPKFLRLLPVNNIQEEFCIAEQGILLDELPDPKSNGFLGPVEGKRIEQSHDDKVDEENRV